jgi:hypothetical protein
VTYGVGQGWNNVAEREQVAREQAGSEATGRRPQSGDGEASQHGPEQAQRPSRSEVVAAEPGGPLCFTACAPETDSTSSGRSGTTPSETMLTTNVDSRLDGVPTLVTAGAI